MAGLNLVPVIIDIRRVRNNDYTIYDKIKFESWSKIRMSPVIH